MKIIIAGAGAVGTHLAKLFSRERHDITLIDDNPERLEGIGSNFEMLTICDSPSSIETLKRADVGKADLFIGVTPDEAHNMTCCMLASKLGAAKTVARVDNYEYTRPEHRDFFKTVGIDSIIYDDDGFGDNASGNGRFARGIYTLQGQFIGSDCSKLAGLPSGIYLVNGKKVAVK